MIDGNMASVREATDVLQSEEPPVIDISSVIAHRSDISQHPLSLEVTRMVAAACQKWGFFQVMMHHATASACHPVFSASTATPRVSSSFSSQHVVDHSIAQFSASHVYVTLHANVLNVSRIRHIEAEEHIESVRLMHIHCNLMCAYDKICYFVHRFTLRSCTCRLPTRSFFICICSPPSLHHYRITNVMHAIWPLAATYSASGTVSPIKFSPTLTLRCELFLPQNWSPSKPSDERSQTREGTLMMSWCV